MLNFRRLRRLLEHDELNAAVLLASFLRVVVVDGELGAGDTCHLDIIDRWGNMVSATPSGGWLQSSPVIPGLGICLGTRAQMFTLTPGLPNSLAPGKRPRTTLSPSLALEAGIDSERRPLIFLQVAGVLCLAQPVTQGLASTSAIAASTGPSWVRWLPYASNAYCITSPVTDRCRFEYLTNGTGSDGQLRPKKSSTEEMSSAPVCAWQGCSSLR